MRHRTALGLGFADQASARAATGQRQGLRVEGFERSLSEQGVTLLRPSRKREVLRAGEPMLEKVRQLNPAWPLDWQRHYAGVQECLDAGAQLADLLPGVTFHGNDIGRWLERQRQHTIWQGLSQAQRERLAALGIEPLAAEPEAPKKAAKGASGAFERA